MVNSQCKVTVKNKDGIELNITISQLYNTYYMVGYNYILCLNNIWDKIIKMQNNKSTNLNVIYTTNFKRIAISNINNLLNINNIIKNTDNLDIKIARKSKSRAKGYSIITENNSYVQIDKFFVRFDEIKRT